MLVEEHNVDISGSVTQSPSTGNSVSLHLLWMLPTQREIPKMAKIMKKNIARTKTPPSYATDAKSVEIKIFIDGIVVKLLRGLINLKVLIPETDFI
jgi:hypothetical protein